MSISPIRFDSMYTRSNPILSKISNSGVTALNSSRVKNETVALEGGPTLLSKVKTIKPEGGPTLAPGSRESRFMPINSNPGATTGPVKFDPATYDPLPPVKDGTKRIPMPQPIEPAARDPRIVMDPAIRFGLNPSEKVDSFMPEKEELTILWNHKVGRNRPVVQPPGFYPVAGNKGDPNRIKPLPQPLPIISANGLAKESLIEAPPADYRPVFGPVNYMA